ncbi:MAG: ribonuclease HIII [Planctomycetota bacterium]
MAQQTQVVVLPFAERQALRDRMNAGAFEFRRVPHALFSVKGEGVVATLYKSGKFVVQGPDPGSFLARYTSVDASELAISVPKGASKPDEIERLDVVTVGSDETGKGDFFGPLVVAAVRVTPEQVEAVRAEGITDSKKLTDPRALQLGAWIREHLPFALAVLDPEDYNRTYASYRNLNPMLADLHAQAIRKLVQPKMRVVVDQFANERLMREALEDTGVELFQATKGERNPAVAAASIVARQEFLVRLRELSERFDIELAKGAGAQVDRAGVNFARTHGIDGLGQVAKMHFKTLDKVRAGL